MLFDFHSRATFGRLPDSQRLSASDFPADSQTPSDSQRLTDSQRLSDYQRLSTFDLRGARHPHTMRRDPALHAVTPRGRSDRPRLDRPRLVSHDRRALWRNARTAWCGKSTPKRRAIYRRYR